MLQAKNKKKYYFYQIFPLFFLILQQKEINGIIKSRQTVIRLWARMDE